MRQSCCWWATACRKPHICRKHARSGLLCSDNLQLPQARGAPVVQTQLQGCQANKLLHEAMLRAELATGCSQRDGSGGVDLSLNLTWGAVHFLCLQAKQGMVERNGRQDRSQALLEWHKVGLSCSTVFFSTKAADSHGIPTSYHTSIVLTCKHASLFTCAAVELPMKVT